MGFRWWVKDGGRQGGGKQLKKKIIRDSLTRFWRAANDFNEYRWVPDVPLNAF